MSASARAKQQAPPSDPESLPIYRFEKGLPKVLPLFSKECSHTLSKATCQFADRDSWQMARICSILHEWSFSVCSGWRAYTWVPGMSEAGRRLCSISSHSRAAKEAAAEGRNWRQLAFEMVESSRLFLSPWVLYAIWSAIYNDIQVIRYVPPITFMRMSTTRLGAPPLYEQPVSSELSSSSGEW